MAGVSTFSLRQIFPIVSMWIEPHVVFAITMRRLKGHFQSWTSTVLINKGSKTIANENSLFFFQFEQNPEPIQTIQPTYKVKQSNYKRDNYSSSSSNINQTKPSYRSHDPRPAPFMVTQDDADAIISRRKIQTSLDAGVWLLIYAIFFSFTSFVAICIVLL